jgi:hypothetical protein
VFWFYNGHDLFYNFWNKLQPSYFWICGTTYGTIVLKLVFLYHRDCYIKILYRMTIAKFIRCCSFASSQWKLLSNFFPDFSPLYSSHGRIKIKSSYTLALFSIAWHKHNHGYPTSALHSRQEQPFDNHAKALRSLPSNLLWAHKDIDHPRVHPHQENGESRLERPRLCSIIRSRRAMR